MFLSLENMQHNIKEQKKAYDIAKYARYYIETYRKTMNNYNILIGIRDIRKIQMKR